MYFGNQSGHLGFWASGLLGFWASGLLGINASGQMGIWAPGHLGSWASGLLGIWASGYLSVHQSRIILYCSLVNFLTFFTYIADKYTNILLTHCDNNQNPCNYQLFQKISKSSNLHCGKAFSRSSLFLKICA